MGAASLERFSRLGPPPADTLPRLMAWREVMGITRVADITGLDRLGIPVMQAVRPFSLSNAVSQGKGVDATTAAISAILESAESSFAERIARFDVEVATANALGVAPERFAKHLLAGAPRDWRDANVPWAMGKDLISGDLERVPFELVHTAYLMRKLPNHGIFAGSTTGLAAALVEDDAIAHGILECIERDAIARAHRVHGFFHLHRIDPATIVDPAVGGLLERLASHDMLVGLWHAPSPLRIPVIWCHLMEKGEGDSALLRFPADGSAAALDPASAIIHAIHEAAQARLAAISGARDDITRASYPKYPDRARIASHRRLLEEGPRPVGFDAIEEHATAFGGTAREALLSALAKDAAQRVLVIGIDTAPLSDLSVVRVVMPGLEPLQVG